MSSRWRGAAIAIAALVALLAAAQFLTVRTGDRDTSGGAPATDTVVANPDVQERIRDVARAQSRADLGAALDELRRLSRPDRSDLVPQLAIFLLDANGEREALAPAVIVERLPISKAEIANAVVPHLETGDPALRRQLENLLGAADEGEGEVADFSVYRAIVARPDGPTPALAGYLYRRSPAQAVRLLAESDATTTAADRTPALAAVERVETARTEVAASGGVSGETRAQAAEALDALSRDPRWWARAYAAAVTRADGRLADLAGAAVRERLESDPDDRVKRASPDGPGAAG